jgi:hypothetical protein
VTSPIPLEQLFIIDSYPLDLSGIDLDSYLINDSQSQYFYCSLRVKNYQSVKLLFYVIEDMAFYLFLPCL